MTKLCLNMIVRNEADRIERCLRSALPYVSCIAICDTGSTDGTLDKICALAAEYGVKHATMQCEFENFSQARNQALRMARDARDQGLLDFDWLLLMDADMELVVADPHAFDCLSNAALPDVAVQMVQKGGTLAYNNTRLLRADQTCVYRGVTHEYLDVAADGLLQGAMFVDHADGSNRSNKADRDIKLLTKDLKTDPHNARSWFYLANSYKDNGQFKRAAKAYEKRIELGGYEEEVWQSIVNRAHCLKDSGDEAGFVKGLLDAYARRPSRVEPLYDLARFYRDKPSHQAVSTLFSEAGMEVPMPADSLFVNTYAYDYGCKDEFAITGFYDPLKREKARKIGDKISLDPNAPAYSRDLARTNSFWYLQPLSAFVPSFRSRVLGNPAADGYTPLNPSVCMYDGYLHVLVRTVNYRMNELGQYLIQGADGSITNDNPINTRNYLLGLDNDLNVEEQMRIHNEKIEPKWSLVRGYEDMRIFERADELWFSATARDRIETGMPQQVLGRIINGQAIFERAMSDGSICEKNWMPIVGSDPLRFAYRLDRFVDSYGNELSKHNIGIDVGHIAGGSQVIPFKGGYLCLVHEARHRPDGDPRRYYSHRFAWLDHLFNCRKLTRLFCFHAREQIEFAAGLCWHPDGNSLVISYGVRDEQAALATVDADELNHWLWHD